MLEVLRSHGMLFQVSYFISQFIKEETHRICSSWVAVEVAVERWLRWSGIRNST